MQREHSVNRAAILEASTVGHDVLGEAGFGGFGFLGLGFRGVDGFRVYRVGFRVLPSQISQYERVWKGIQGVASIQSSSSQDLTFT